MNIGKSEKIILSIIATFILVIIVLGVSYSMFNYTKNGPTNLVKTGRMVFNTSQNEVNLVNVFPISSANALIDNENTDSIIISFVGDTTYSDGLEYMVSVTDVQVSLDEKKIPIALISTIDGLGATHTYDDYMRYRGGFDSVNTLYSLTDGIYEDGQRIMLGYIAPGELGINGTITIKAYIPDTIAITDTYDETESDEMGTTKDWVAGRTVLTTEEWNRLSEEPLSFKIKIDAMEGIWINN